MLTSRIHITVPNVCCPLKAGGPRSHQQSLCVSAFSKDGSQKSDYSMIWLFKLMMHQMT